MGTRIFTVDAFSRRLFSGNPAGVCMLEAPADDVWMQAVAREINLSETAFLIPEGEGYRLRWFTPAVEVDLCGHATLASAHILYEQGLLKPRDRARFFTKSGLLTAEKQGDDIIMDFPAECPHPVRTPDTLPEALGADILYCGKNRFDYLVEVTSETVLRALRPDSAAIAALPARGVIVTAEAGCGEYDFVSRFFAPSVGVAEDPVTGSAHCCLGPYWRERTGKDMMKAFQASLRGGELSVRVAGDRIMIGGAAATVIEGMLR